MCFMDRYIEFFCLGFCFLHMIFSFVQSFIQHKKIKSICEKCLSPVLEGEEHQCSEAVLHARELVCSLPEEQLILLSQFVQFLKKDGV